MAGERRSRVTLEDVARRAEVSRALVSIVMREAPGASDATRARVLAAAAELGYRPDVRARALAGQTSRLVGVMFGVGVGDFHFDLLDGLYAEAERRGLALVPSPLTRNRDERRAAQSLQDFAYDALIMLGPPTADPLLAGQLPVVVLGWHVDHPAVDSVRTSDEEGMARAVAHLVGLGHTDIAHVDGGDGVIGRARREAYLSAMRSSGLSDRIRVVAGGQSQLDGQHAARRLLALDRLPTAVIAYNDDVAAALVALLAQHEVAVPGRVSVVGWDDNAAAALSPIALTSVAQRPAELARLALDRVEERIEQRRVTDREIVLEPELRVRASTAPPG